MRAIQYFILVLFVSLHTAGINAATPLRDEMLQRVKKQYEHISAKLLGDGGIDREYRDGFYVDIFSQPFEIVQKSDYPEHPAYYTASLKYIKSGNSWVFEQFTVGSVNYPTIPPPDKMELIKVLNANIAGWLQPNISRAVGELSPITYPADPEWNYRNPVSLDFQVLVTFSEKVSYTELEKAEHKYKVSVTRPSVNEPWVVNSGFEIANAKKVISKSKYTSQELDNMKTMQQVVQESAAQNTMNALPKVEKAPVFQSDKQLFYYIHEKILNSPNGPTSEAYLMTVVDESCYENNSTVFFKSFHADWINNVARNVEAYQAAFCPTPTTKAYQTSRIEFFDRELRSFVELSAIQRGNTWKLTTIRFAPANKTDWVRLKAIETNCQGKPELAVQKVESFAVGDKVSVQFSNGTFPCTITKLDTDNENRYFVKLDNDNSGKGYWIDANFISKGSGAGSSIKNALNTLGSKELSFKVGDEVEVNTSAGWLKAKIVQNLGIKFKVKFVNPQFADMWVTKDLIR